MKGSANAGLTVKWLLIQGTADFAVPISQIMRIVDALGRADKPFDLMILPEFGHGGNTRVIRYWQDRASEYLVEHLRTFIPSWHGSRKAQAFAQLGFVTFVTRKS